MKSHTSRAILLGLMISLVLSVLVFTFLTRERNPVITVNNSLDPPKPFPRPAVQPAEKTEPAPTVEDHKVVDVELKQCGTITGIVYARDTGRPIPGVTVSASHQSARTDSDGRYRLDKVTRTPVVSFNHRG